MSKEKQPEQTREMFAAADERLARVYDILEKSAQEREEDRKRAEAEREEDRKRAEAEREADRKKAEAERKKAEAEREEDRKRERERDEKIAQERAKEREEDRKRDEERSAKAAEEMAEIRRGIKETRKLIGDHTNNEGELLETICKVALAKMGEIDGVPLDDVQGMKSDKHGVEVDVVGVNGKVLFPVEVKRTMSPEDVRHFVEVRVERFKKAFVKDKEVRPVIIFGLPRSGETKEDPVEVALELGLIAMQSIGENKLATITDPSQVVKRQHKD